MNIGFYLARKSARTTSVDCVCSAGMRYKKATGLIVEVRYWDSTKQRCREVKDYPSARSINQSLKKISDAATKVAEQVVTELSPVNNKQFWERVDIELTGGVRRRTQFFVDYFEEYVGRRKLRGAISTAKKYFTTLQKLKAFERKTRHQLTFRDINLQFYERFERYICHEQGFTLNYFSSITRCIKVAYRDARDIDGLHNLRETEKRGFSSPFEAAKSVYLTSDELQRIADVEISVESLIATFPEYANSRAADLARKVTALDLARNKFILGAYTALRVSDFNHLKDIHISDGFLRVRTKKTGAVVIIPVHPNIRRLIEAGFDISSPITEQKINIHIKEIARMAGITQPVEATKLINHRAVTDWWPKCDVITTHTARRSAATNMYKAGIPSISIMRITGHTTEKSFMKYIRITNEENAELMAKNAFFIG